MDAKIDKSGSSADHHGGPRFVDVATSALGHLVDFLMLMMMIMLVSVMMMLTRTDL